jgi:gliding motility-associated-like protein
VFYVPNAFTPTGDDRNEVFKVVGRGVSKYTIVIYDRWGSLIYHGTDINQGWDGTINGKPAKVDVYNWLINASSLRGQIKEFSGHVTLYR